MLHLQIKQSPSMPHPDLSLHFSGGFLLFDIVALVVGLFAFAETKQNLDVSLFHIHLEWNQNFARLKPSHNFVEFMAMHEKSACSCGTMILSIAVSVLTDVGLLKHQISSPKNRVGIRQIDLAESTGFDLGSFEFDSCFVGFIKMIIESGLSVF